MSYTSTSKKTTGSRKPEGDTRPLGCANCKCGWVLFMRPANKVVVNNIHIYGDEDTTMIEFAEPCPVCNNGQRWVENVMMKADIPAVFYDADMDSFDWNAYGVDTDLQKKIAKSFVLDYKTVWKPRGMGLYIWSKTKGSGKTFLASAICNSLIKGFRLHPRMVNVANLIDIKQNDESQIADLINSDLLVIDDIGQKETGVEWVSDILYQILDARIQNRAVTIATSNYDMDELNVDDRVFDRINRMMQEIHLPEYSVRMRDAKKEKRNMLKELGIIPDDRSKQMTIGG